MANNNLIIKNTVYLLFRLLITVLSGFYISRVVLQELGSVDFGIYNVVGGVIASLVIFTGSLSSSISRFFYVEIGLGKSISGLFSTTFILQLFLSVIVLIIGLSLKGYIIERLLNIPLEKITISKYVFTISLFIFISNLLIIPFSSILIAYENMKVYSNIGVLDTMLKLAMLFLLKAVSYDKLLVYILLQLVVSLLILCCYIFYCFKYYKNIKCFIIIDWKLVKRIGSFSGWNTIGVFANILKEQGINILINIFCGPSMNAARGIAFQISSSLALILNNMLLAVNPRITKLHAANGVESSYNLMEKSARFAACFMMLLIVPLLVSLDSILKVWLVNIPDFTRHFAYLSLINIMIETFSFPIISLMLANGNIKAYQLVVGLINIMSFPLAYVILHTGLSAYITMYVLILISVINLFARLYMLSRKVNINKRRYLTQVVSRVLVVFIITLSLSSFLSGCYKIDGVILNILLNTSLTLFIVASFTYIFCLNADEKIYILKSFRSLICRC